MFRNKFFRRSALLAGCAASSLVSAAFLGAAPAIAADAPATPSSADAVDKSTATAVKEVVVTGIRHAQQSAVRMKEDASQVLDAISAEDIGKLPDATISDSLQRIPGVQVERDAGEAGALNIRGLPQVASMLNGEAFLGANSITTVQPNFGDIPSQLMRGAVVTKSSQASQLGAGIAGSVDLLTWRPFDFKSGLTMSGAVEGTRGELTGDVEPSVNGLASWRNDRVGLLVSLAYSDLTAANEYNGLEGNTGWATTSAEQNVNPNDQFISYEGHTAYNKSTERQRLGGNLAFQADLDNGFKLEAEFFNTNQTQWDRSVGFVAESKFISWDWFDPTKSTDTGFSHNGSDLNTVQQYDLNAPMMKSQTGVTRTDSRSDNFNVGLNYDNGGPFTGSLRAIYAKADQKQTNFDADIELADGSQWGGQYVYLPGVGRQAIDPNGYHGLMNVTVDYSGDTPAWGGPGLAASGMSNVNNYNVGSVYAANDYDRVATLNVERFDGHYRFNEYNKLDFGVRLSLRDIGNTGFNMIAPRNGCYTEWVAVDVMFNAGGGACTAGDGNGHYYSAAGYNPLTNYQYMAFSNPGGVTGLPTAYAINPYSINDPEAWFRSQYPGAKRDMDPGSTYGVRINQTSGYVQDDFNGEVFGKRFGGNLGAQIINTHLDVRQSDVDGTSSTAYGLTAGSDGSTVTQRDFVDVLPSINAAIDLMDKVKLRGAIAKNMTMLDAQDWGGALTMYYSAVPGKNYLSNLGGNALGNPKLDPWRSTNYDLSLEWYNAPGSMFSAAVFYIDVKSFIEQATVYLPEPDSDGVVRGDAPINENVQKSGGHLDGIELSAKQAFTYLPGIWKNFGVDANYTYAPSDSGERDPSGKVIPFQDNSVNQMNFAVWYQKNGFEFRIADNYRSRRAVSADQLGIKGLELWQAPTNYVDAMVSYDVRRNLTLYLQGANLTGESESYYIGWPNQYAYQNIFEQRVTLGARARF